MNIPDTVKPGDTVHLQAWCDLWMRGARVGTLERIGRKYLHVRFIDGKVHKVTREMVASIMGE